VKTKLDDGGPAFPVPETFDRDGDPQWTVDLRGMSLRDYFAAKAMSGLLADPEERPTTAGLRVFYKATAETAYEIADAMLAERAKKGGAN